MNFKNIPIEFIDTHLSNSQKELLNLKWRIYSQIVLNDSRERKIDLADKYNLSIPRFSEILRELKNNKRIRAK